MQTRIAAACLALVLIVAGCGSSGDAQESPSSDIGVSISSGTFTTTVDFDDVTEVPFSETIVVEALFEESIYGAAGQTSVYAQASPAVYRIGSRPPRNERTFVFSLSNRSPGTVEISIYENRDTKPLTFTVQVGEQ